MQVAYLCRMKYEDLVKNHSAQMIEKLVTEFLARDPAEIHFDFEDNDQWSVISMHIYEEDKEIAIRARAGDRYDLYFGYYDEQDEFFEIIQPLTEEEKSSLPKALRKAMSKVLADERGMRLPGNFLSR